MKFFGDSYDLVKRCLLVWLRPIGEWAVHPMFAEPVADAEAAAFGAFLGAPLVSTVPLSYETDRRSYFDWAGDNRHLFFDPNTGVRMDGSQPRNDPDYIYS